MKKFLFLIILLVNALIFNACSSAGEPKTSANSGANTAAANANNQTIQNATPVNIITTSEAEKKSREVFNNEGNVNAQTTAEPSRNSKDNIYAGRAAPDDSIFNTTMNAKGQFVETRTFNNHPQLAKVERVFITPKEKIIYVYLKDATTFRLADDRLPNFQATAPGNILAEIGFLNKGDAPAANIKGKSVEQKAVN